MKKTLVALCAAAVVLPSCGGSPEAAESTPARVTVEHVAFSPASLKVDAGTEVTWTNRDADVVHTATSGIPGDKGVPGLDNGTPARPDGTFDGEMDGADASYSFTFEEPGTYAYFCRVHQSMTGGSSSAESNPDALERPNRFRKTVQTHPGRSKREGVGRSARP